MNERFFIKKGDIKIIKRGKNITKDEKPTFIEKVKGLFKKRA